MIKIEKISFKYKDDWLFKDFSKTIEDGKKVVITGESGAGKSTFLSFFAGFLQPQKGEIFIDDLQLNSENISEIRKKTAWLPQDFNVPFDTVNELFISPFELKINKDFRPTDQQINDIFQKLGLEPDMLTKKINQISGGQKQRVLLASIILLKKKYIFLDEPTSALDDKSTQMLINTMFALKDTTILAATHDKLFAKNADFSINL